MTWISYAQNHEDVALMRALGGLERGFYIDVGANDPRADSVTRAFYERGWCGINIEPVGQWFERLVADRPRDHNLRVAAGASAGRMRLFDVVDTGLSSADPELAQRHARDGRVVREVEVPVRRLDDICAELAVGDVHFLKIDVEGAETAVLQGLDFQRVRPWIVVVEATLPGSDVSAHEQWESLLTAHGYLFAWFDGLNRFYVVRERASLADALARPPSVFDDFMRYTERLLRDDVADYAVLLQAERERSAQLQAQLQSQLQHQAQLQAQAGLQAQARIDELLASRSWRMTAPLRWLGDRVRAVRRAVRGTSSTQRAPTDSTAHPGLTPATAPNAPAVTAPAIPATPARLPRLAVVSVLPPARSGVADYCAALLPALAAHYDIELITDQDTVTDPWALAHCPIRRIDWFEAHADHFDRIVYHLGNSMFQAHLPGLLARHPGTVVLHDLVLADLLHHLERTGAQPFVFQRALLASHGWPALRDAARRGLPVAVRAWPASRFVFDTAHGVILNSDYAIRWVRSLYGPGLAVALGGLARSPLLAPGTDRPASAIARTAARLAARTRLGLDPQTFLVCSFGVVDPSKCCHRLLAAWRARSPASAAPARLVFVGDNPPSPDAPALASDDADPQRQVSVTGHVDPATYRDWLLAADLAVQLRASTRGESSGAALDCLAAGLPLIVNAHGPMADLPPACVHRLADDFSDAELTAALDTLASDPAQRDHLAGEALDFLARHHDPVIVAARHARAIEDFHRQAHDSAVPPRRAPRQLLVDVTALALHDLGSGIQRVVRSVVNALLDERHGDLRIEPVYLDAGQYRYARQWCARAFAIDPDAFGDDPVEVRAGDVFLGLDLVTHAVHVHESVFADWRARGVAIHFVVYDLLPLQLSHCFPEPDAAHFRSWLSTVCRVADGLACISQATALELRDRLPALAPQRPIGPAVDWFHLGADIPASLPTQGLSDPDRSLLAALATRPVFLMVGTVEPRKGHAQALDAFEQLWAQGVQADLLIVGRAGWMVDSLVARLRAHPQAGARLIWLERASDELLLALYRRAAALLMASLGEGFGLPLIEAAQHGLPIIARDLPVFREVAGDHATYWQGDAASLAGTLTRWLAQHRDGLAQGSAAMPWLTWRESTERLLRIVLGPALAAPATPSPATPPPARAPPGRRPCSSPVTTVSSDAACSTGCRARPGPTGSCRRCRHPVSTCATPKRSRPWSPPPGPTGCCTWPRRAMCRPRSPTRWARWRST